MRCSKTKNNAIWLFKANRDLILEESVFMDKNDVKETKQIVIKGITKQNREKIQWSLTKKGKCKCEKDIMDFNPK